jgi:hypothetical protein
MAAICGLAQIEERMLTRNRIVEEFFYRESPRLAEACRAMSEWFLNGGRLLAFGRRRQLVDFSLVVQCDYIPRIQEVQASIYHIIRENLEGLRLGEA